MKPTPSHSLLPQSAAEKLIVAQALALYRDSKNIAKSALHGQFLNHAEAAIINKGREFIQHSLQTLLQEEIHDIEKTILPVLRGETRECPKCQTKKRHLGYRNTNIFTAAGKIKVQRLYDEYRPCTLPEHTVDNLLGITDYTVGFRSLAARAGINSSFQQAAETLLFYGSSA